jgi:hypothetical protein
MFLDSAELRVRERKDLTLRYWRETVDSLLNFQGKVVLQGAGSISNKQNENKVRLINEGKPTIIEEGIAELCAEAHAKGLMSATMDYMRDCRGGTSTPTATDSRLTSSAISGRRSFKGFKVVDIDPFEFLGL